MDSPIRLIDLSSIGIARNLCLFGRRGWVMLFPEKRDVEKFSRYEDEPGVYWRSAFWMVVAYLGLLAVWLKFLFEVGAPFWLIVPLELLSVAPMVVVGYGAFYWYKIGRLAEFDQLVSLGCLVSLVGFVVKLGIFWDSAWGIQFFVSAVYGLGTYFFMYVTHYWMGIFLNRDTVDD